MIKSEKGLYLWIFLKMDPFLLLKKDLAFKVWLYSKIVWMKAQHEGALTPPACVLHYGGSHVVQWVKNLSACYAGDLGWIPGLGRSPEEGNGNSSILAWRIPIASTREEALFH